MLGSNLTEKLKPTRNRERENRKRDLRNEPQSRPDYRD